jgi:hypothetical protein
MGTHVIIAVVLVILIIIFAYNMKMYSIYSDQMEGLWMAPDSFCAESDIDGMLVYVGPVISGGVMTGEKRKACLIMHANNTTIAYKKLELRISSAGLSMLLPMGIDTSWSRTARVSDDTRETDDLETGIIDESDDASTIPLGDIMPDRITIMMDLKEGKMTWTGKPLPDAPRNEKGEDKITYAELYKDNISSALGRNLTGDADVKSIDASAYIPETA